MFDMHFSAINFLTNDAWPLFKEHSVSLSALQKKVVLVAIIAFSCLAVCYIFCQKFSQSDKEEDISNSCETEQPIQNGGETLNFIVAKDLMQGRASKLEIYPLLLSNDQEIYKHIDITLKNASDLEDARVVLMGESHTIRKHAEIQFYNHRSLGKR